MINLQAAISSQALTSVAATLLHSLWQATVLAGLLWVALRLVPAKRVNLRYSLTLAAMLAVVIVALVTFKVCEMSSAAALVANGTSGAIVMHAENDYRETAAGGAAVSQPPWDRGAAPAGNHVKDTVPAGAYSPAAGKIDNSPIWATCLVIVWMAGAVLTLMRVALSLRGAAECRRLAQPVAGQGIEEVVQELRSKLGIGRAVAVAICGKVTSPAVIGIIVPIILLPPAALTGVPVEQLRAILAHELAHVRRCDWLVNVLQMLVESLGFFNPAVWWISRQIRVEREASCDAVAAKVIGAPSNMARALVDWCHRVKDAPLTAALALAGEKHSTLSDRVRRLAMPGHRPAVRLPWHTFTILILAATLALAILAKGTSLAVEVAAQMLTPEQRVEKLSQATTQYGASFVSQRGQAQISGQVRAVDGSKLKSIEITTWSKYEHGTTVQSVYSTDGRFGTPVESGVLWIGAKAEGFAPSLIGPLEAKAGGKLANLEIILKRGYESRIQCVDESGSPVAGVKLSAAMPFSSSQMGAGHFTSGSDGMTVLSNLKDIDYNLYAERDGYEPAGKDKIRLKPGSVIKWQIKKALPLEGLIVDEAGKPVKGASVRLFSNGVECKGPYGEVLAITNEQGLFKLTSLGASWTNILYIEHPQLGRKLVRNVKVSSTQLRIVMDPLTVRGRIIGDLKKLKVGPGGVPVATYGLTVPYADDSSYGFGVEPGVPVEIKAGQARFEIHGLPPCRLSVTAGAVSESLQLTREGTHEIVIDLDKEFKFPKRKVVLRLLPPQGQPLPTGTVELQSPKEGGPYIAESVKLVNGEASIEAYVGQTVFYRPERMVGAWMPEGHMKTVPPGDGPLVVETQTYPAGAIVGHIVDEAGKPFQGRADVRLYVKQSPPCPPGVQPSAWSVDNNVQATVNPMDGTFMLTPVPVGGVYSAVVSRGSYYVASDLLKVDVANPMPTVELRVGKGVTMALKVAGPDGKAISGVPVTFEYQLKNAGAGSWSPPVLTDPEGIVRFEDINPDAGEYFGKIEMTRDYQPVRSPLAPVKNPTAVKLEKGLVLEGHVIDDATGWPVPDAEVRAAPRTIQSGAWFTHKAENKTDKDGRFRISTLSDQSFSIMIDQANSADSTQHYYQPSQDKHIVVRVKIPEWSKLKPRKPD